MFKRVGAILALGVLAASLPILPAHGGAIRGPQYGVALVDAHDSDFYEVWFRGGELAMIWVSGDGDTDLDLFVYDADEYELLGPLARRIASDTDLTDQCFVCFIPPRTQRYVIEVRNLGSISNLYRIETN